MRLKLDIAMDMISDRNLRVLQAVVESYISRPMPVGSRLVTKKYSFNLSPATIRNIMADLEEMGYLIQPHTSAGRVPTDKGYRFYLDSQNFGSLPEDDEFQYMLTAKIRALRDDFEEFLRESTRMLSGVTHLLGFAVPMKADTTTLNRIQFFRYRGRQTVALLLSNEGLIKNKILANDFGLSQRDLNRIADFLNSEFSGRTVSEIRAKLVEQISKEKALCDILITKAAEICADALYMPGDDIYFAGLSDMLRLPEFSDGINFITSAIEDKSRIVNLLDGLSETDGVTVLIGSENPVEHMKELSMVVARYKQGNRSLGTVGMIGPKRMDYERVIPMVKAMAGFISRNITS